MSRNYDHHWKKRASKGKPVGPPTAKQRRLKAEGEAKRADAFFAAVASRTPAELWAEADTLGKESCRLGSECQPLLEAYGAHEPRAWTQTQLRAFVFDLRRQGDVHEALAVERYADSRVAWGNAINAYKVARDTPVNATLATHRKAPGVPAKPLPTHRPRSIGGWVGRPGPMPPIEPWHATVPPWEDRPVSPIGDTPAPTAV